MRALGGILLFALAATGCDDDGAPNFTIDLSIPADSDLALMHGTDAATNASVDVMDDFYAPSNVSITHGGTVTWTWRGSDMHTVTSDTGSTEMFDSSPAKNSGTFMHIFAAAGAFGYHCDVHGAAMAGTITVQ